MVTSVMESQKELGSRAKGTVYFMYFGSYVEKGDRRTFIILSCSKGRSKKCLESDHFRDSKLRQYPILEKSSLSNLDF